MTRVPKSSNPEEKENWDVPLNFRPFNSRREFHDKDIPLLATSYYVPKRRTFRQKVKDKLQLILLRVQTPSSNRHWKSDWESRIAFTSIYCNASTFFRFPVVFFHYGKGAFLLAYFLIVIFVMQPLIYTAIVLGRMYSLETEVLPIFYMYTKVISFASFFMCIIFMTYSNVVLGYAGVYVFTQLFQETPDNCYPKLESKFNCIPYKEINPGNSPGLQSRVLSSKTHLSSDLYFRYEIQGDNFSSKYNDRSDTTFNIITRFFSERWRLYACMVIVFLVIVLIVRTRIVVSCITKVIICGGVLLPVFLLCLIIFQWTQGGLNGFSHLSFEWKFLGTLEFWIEALGFAFQSCLCGFGILSRVVNLKANSKGLYQLSWIVCGCVLLLALLSVLLVASEVSIIEKISNIKDYFPLLVESSGLTFICLSNVLMKISEKWASIVFFAYMMIFPLSSQLFATGVAIVSFKQLFHVKLNKTRRVLLILIIISMKLTFISVFVTDGGPFIFSSNFIFGGSWVACILCLFQVITAIKVDVFEKFSHQLNVDEKENPPKCFVKQLKYTTIPLLIISLIPMTAYLFLYDNFLPESSLQWVMIYGWILNLFPILCMIILLGASYRKNKVAPLLSLKNNRGSQSTKSFFPWNIAQILQSSRYAVRRNATFYKHSMDKKSISEYPSAFRLQELENEMKIIYIFQVQQMEQIQKLKLLEKYSVENVFTAANLTDFIPLENNDDDTLVLQKIIPNDAKLDQITASNTLKNKFDTLSSQPMSGITLKRTLANGIIQVLHEPYSNACKWNCPTDGNSDLLMSRNTREDTEKYGGQLFTPDDEKEKDPIEFVINFRLKKHANKRLHIIVVEGIHHSLLLRLPNPAPLSSTIPLRSVANMNDNERLQHISSKVLLYLYHTKKAMFTDETQSTSATTTTTQIHGQQEDGEDHNDTFKYTKLIEAHKSSMGPFNFLDPKKVFVAVIDTRTEDQLNFDNKVKNVFIDPLLNGGRGYILKPTRRKLTTQQINELIKHPHLPGDVHLMNLIQMQRRNKLIKLKNKLLHAPSDIIFKPDDKDDNEPVYKDDNITKQVDIHKEGRTEKETHQSTQQISKTKNISKVQVEKDKSLVIEHEPERQIKRERSTPGSSNIRQTKSMTNMNFRGHEPENKVTNKKHGGDFHKLKKSISLDFLSITGVWSQHSSLMKLRERVHYVNGERHSIHHNPRSRNFNIVTVKKINENENMIYITQEKSLEIYKKKSEAIVFADSKDSISSKYKQFLRTNDFHKTDKNIEHQ